MPLQLPLIQTYIIDKAARAKSLEKQLSLFVIRAHPVPESLEYFHQTCILGLMPRSKRELPYETDYRRGRSVVSALHVHLVFVTKYRRNVLSNRALEVLNEAFKDVCVDFGATLNEMNGEDDHVHLLLEYPVTVQLSKLVNSLKGVSSRLLRQKRYPEVQAKLWGGHLWSPSYFAASCGGAPLSIIKQYIERQRLT